jgi:hypothetical protein
MLGAVVIKHFFGMLWDVLCGFFLLPLRERSEKQDIGAPVVPRSGSRGSTEWFPAACLDLRSAARGAIVKLPLLRNAQKHNKTKYAHWLHTPHSTYRPLLLSRASPCVQ